MFTVVSHEYDEATGIDHFVFDPGNMKAQIKIIEEGGEPKVLLGVDSTAVQVAVAEPTWSVCANKFIADIALEYYAARQA